MPRYIDADDFKKEMECYLPEDRELALKVLKRIKTADVVERKRGKWRLNKEGNWACPFCEFDPYHDEMNGMNYCPNCGARLEGFDNGKVH